MSYYTGKEPCSGCKRPGTEKARPSKGDLCEDCRKQIVLGRALQKQKGQDARAEQTLSATWYMFGHIFPDIKDGSYRGEWEKADEMNELLRAMLTGLSVEFLRHTYRGDFNVDGSSLTAREGWVFKEGQAEPVYNFLQAYNSTMRAICEWEIRLQKAEQGIEKTIAQRVAEVKDKVFMEGVEQGRDLLKQLTAGHITLKELNDATFSPYEAGR